MKILGEDVNLTFIRENMSFLFVVPTVLGGIWQVIELLSMGASF